MTISTVESVINHIHVNGGDPRTFFNPAPRGGWLFQPFHMFVSTGEYARVIDHFESLQ